MIGGFGEAEVFSFHATKFINALEGGAILTNNDDLAGKIRLMKNFGFTYYDRVEYIGVNGKMNEISAAMGLTALESMEEFIAVNRRNYKVYMDELEGIRGLQLMSYGESERSNYQYVVVEVDETETHVSRDQLVDILHAENVLARRYFYPGCHRMEPYRSYFPHAGLLLPETERLAKRVMCLPTGSSIGPDEIVNLCQIIRLVIENGIDIRQRLQSSAESSERSKIVGEATR
jgi:dTDP-4-amino-4,6-dideoxygalactose transaminase